MNRMKHSIRIATLLLAAVGTAEMKATPVFYTISFALQSGTPGAPLPTSATFDYDAGVPQFTNFIVNWDGLSFDMTNAANNPQINSFSAACVLGDTGAAASFLLLTNCGNPVSGLTVTTWFANGNLNPQIFNFYSGDAMGGNNFIQFTANPTSVVAPFNTEALGTFTVTAVPEVGTCAVVLVGLGLVVGTRIANLRRPARKAWLRRLDPQQW
jgi:hypothetical protein